MSNSSQPVKTRPRRRAKTIFLAMGGSFLAAFAVGEILVRFVSEAPLPEREPLLVVRANEFRGWEMVPGVHYTYHHPVNINEHGFRGPEIQAKRDGETRIMALGDSLIYGQGVPDDGTVPHFLREELGDAFTVINTGHRAYATPQELGVLREFGEALEPDIVVVFWYWNDLIERDIEQTNARLEASGPIAFDVGKRMEGATRFKWHAKQFVRRSALIMYLHDQVQARRRETSSATDEDFVSEGMERFRGYVEALKEESARIGSKLYFAIIPDPAVFLRTHYSTPIEEKAKAILAEFEVPTLELKEPLGELYRERGSLPVVPYDYHYLPEGNRVIAQTVAAWLRSR